MKKGIFLLTASALLTACGGGGSSSDDSSSNDISQQKAGIYTGSSMISTETGSSILLITQDSDVLLVSDEAEILLGEASESGSSVKLTTRYYTDGAESDWGRRITADLTYNNATLAGPYTGFEETGNFSFIRDSALYERSISLTDFAGTWLDEDGLPYPINGNGILSAVNDPDSGCTITGDFDPEAAGYNEFEIDFLTTGCDDPDLNGEWDGYGFFSDENGMNSVINFALLNDNEDYFMLGELTKQ